MKAQNNKLTITTKHNSLCVPFSHFGKKTKYKNDNKPNNTKMIDTHNRKCQLLIFLESRCKIPVLFKKVNTAFTALVT